MLKVYCGKGLRTHLVQIPNVYWPNQKTRSSNALGSWNRRSSTFSTWLLSSRGRILAVTQDRWAWSRPKRGSGPVHGAHKKTLVQNFFDFDENLTLITNLKAFFGTDVSYRVLKITGPDFSAVGCRYV